MVALKDAAGKQVDAMNVTFATNATCTCLGHCACACDQSTGAVQRCVDKESVPAEDDGGDGASGGGLDLGFLSGEEPCATAATVRTYPT